MTDDPTPVIVLSGIPGVGKSTIAPLLAGHFERAVHLEADTLQKMIVSGGQWPGDPLEGEGLRQLRLRLTNVCLLADSFCRHGFVPIIDDIVVGTRLDELRADIQSRPLYFVLLVPRLEVIADRNAGRPDKNVFEQARHLDPVARAETADVGLRIDTSDQTPEQSAAEILDRLWNEARVG